MKINATSPLIMEDTKYNVKKETIDTAYHGNAYLLLVT